MDDLRTEIREAFEREQAGRLPALTLRQDIAAAVKARPRQAPNLQWLAVATAILLTVAVVAGLLSTRLLGRSVPVQPRPTPVATPSVDYGPPPAGVALVYVADPKHPGWYNAFDWTGKPRGTIKLAAPLDSSERLLQAPDGSGFVATVKGMVVGDFLDRLGQDLPGTASPSGQTRIAAMWADDSRHVCYTVDSAGSWWLGIAAPDQAARNVALIATDTAAGQSSIAVASCSPKTDRAVLVRTTVAAPAELWVVRLSDGKVLRHAAIAAHDQLSTIVVSGDGTVMAENSAKSSGALMGPTAPRTAVVRTADGSLVTNLDPSMAVLAFSADDSFALVTTSPWASGVPTGVAAVDLRTGAVLWRYAGTEELSSYFAQPGGDGFAVLLQDPGEQAIHSSVDLTIVHAGGATTQVPGRYAQP